MLRISCITLLVILLFCACNSNAGTPELGETNVTKTPLSDISAFSDNYLVDETVADSIGPIALAGMPEWKPGRIGENSVAVSYGIAVRFLLEKAENLNGIYILPYMRNKPAKLLQ